MEILGVLQRELPGEWSIRGGGLKALLVGESIGWAIRWIGCSKASSVRVHAGVAPAVTAELRWTMNEYGLDMVDVPRGPRSIKLGEDGDLAVTQEFAGQALARFEELTPERYADWAERSLQLLSEPELPPGYILMAPGWRVVNDSGDPVGAAEGCIDWAERRWPKTPEVIPPKRRFYEGLIEVCKAGGREQALEYLTDNRDRQLAEQGYDDPRFRLTELGSLSKRRRLPSERPSG